MAHEFLNPDKQKDIESFYNEARKKKEDYRKKMLRFSGHFNGLTEKDDAKIETTLNDMVKKEQKEDKKTGKRKNLFFQLTRDNWEQRANLEAGYALTRGMTFNEIFSEKPEDIQKMQQLNKEFHNVFDHDYSLSESQQKDHDTLAGKEYGKIVKYFDNHYAFASWGDLSDDRVLLDHYDESHIADYAFGLLGDMDKLNKAERNGAAQVIGKPGDDPEKLIDDFVHVEIPNGYRTLSQTGRTIQGRLRFLDGTDQVMDKILQEKEDDSAQNDHMIRQAATKAYLKAASESPDYEQEALRKKPVMDNLSGNILDAANTFSDDFGTKFNKGDPIAVRNAKTIFNSAMPGSKELPFIAPSYKKNSLESNYDVLEIDPDHGLTFSYGSRDRAEGHYDPLADEKDKKGNIIDPLAFKRAAERKDGSFTASQKDYANKLFENSLDRVFGTATDQGDKLQRMGLNQFDCIFINGKSVNDLYGKNTDESVKRAYVAAAGLYGSKNITYTMVKGDEKTGYSFSKPHSVKRRMEEGDSLHEPQKYGKWHSFRKLLSKSYKPESITEKFARAAENDADARRKTAPAVEKLNRLATALNEKDKKNAIRKINYQKLTQDGWEFLEKPEEKKKATRSKHKDASASRSHTDEKGIL